MSSPPQEFAIRAKDGISFFRRLDGKNERIGPSASVQTVGARNLVYSKDGQLVAWSTNERVVIAHAATGEPFQELAVPKTSSFVFSPRNTYLATWQHPGPNVENMHIWDIKTGAEVAKFFQKSANGWEPQWTDDESLCARIVTGEVHFYNGANIQAGIQTRLQLPGVAHFELSTGSAPHKVAVFVPEIKGAPAFVRIFAYNSWQTPISNKAFYKAEKVQMIWNKNGTRVLVMTSTEVDSTDKSYFGETGLYFLDSTGKVDCRVALDKEGPVHDICWSPNSKEFVVVYGFMPAKAVLFDLKCNPIFDFGAHPVNTVRFSPQGQVVCLAGFGNLSGEMQFWDREKLKLHSTISARDTTHMEWAPDGQNLVTATLFPRLRVDNGYKIWNVSGALVDEAFVTELYQFTWAPKTLPATPLPPPTANATQKVDTGAPAPQPVKKPSAYVPPHLRGQQGPSAPRALHELLHENVSNSSSPVGTPPPKESSPSNSKKGKDKEKDKDQEKGKGKEKPKKEEIPQNKEEIEKKIKAVNKKLKEVQGLKEQQASGKELEKNQLEKVKREAAFQKELQDLEKALLLCDTK